MKFEKDLLENIIKVLEMLNRKRGAGIDINSISLEGAVMLYNRYKGGVR